MLKLRYLPKILFGLAMMYAADVSAKQVRATIAPIPDPVWRNMIGKSWHAHLPCPPREALALLRIPYWDFAGHAQWGSLIVARAYAEKVASAFQEIFDSRAFQIEKMRLIDDYNGSDDASMDDNNTSAFNCRKVEGGKGMSKHAYGLAIDINPVQNPHRDARGTAPKSGSAYDDDSKRRNGVTGLITRGDIVTRAFQRIGWSWGGNFKHIRDYQHFAQ